MKRSVIRRVAANASIRIPVASLPTARYSKRQGDIMKLTAFAHTIFAAFCVAGSAVAQPTAPASPSTVEQSICRPQLQVDKKQSAAGMAFVLQASGRSFLVTAQHLFGPDGGFAKEIAWEQMPQRAKIPACEPFKGGDTWSSKAALAIPGARTGDGPENLRDFAALALAPETPAPALPLADHAPVARRCSPGRHARTYIPLRSANRAERYQRRTHRQRAGPSRRCEFRRR